MSGCPQNIFIFFKREKTVNSKKSKRNLFSGYLGPKASFSFLRNLSRPAQLKYIISKFNSLKINPFLFPKAIFFNLSFLEY